MPEQNIIYVFLDGVGIGNNDPKINPFARFETTFFKGHTGNISDFKNPGVLISTDAQMGIPGLPQSATGQTALFTGYNGPQIMGRHVNGFPTFTLRPYFKQKNMLKIFNENRLNASLLNSYSALYLKRLKHPRAERILSASSLMQLYSGKPYFTLQDYEANRSLYMDLTNWFLRKNGMDIPFASAYENGRKLCTIAKNYHLSVFEYFFTDKVGHEQSWGAAKRIIRHVDNFLQGIWDALDRSCQTVIISSDHGNLEDLTRKTHTPNPVGTIVYGKHEERIAREVRRLCDIPRTLYSIFDLPFDESYIPSQNLITGTSH